VNCSRDFCKNVLWAYARSHDTCYSIQWKNSVYTGDLIPTIAHIPLIWNMSYDIESLKTIDEKEQLLKESLEGTTSLFFSTMRKSSAVRGDDAQRNPGERKIRVFRNYLKDSL